MRTILWIHPLLLIRVGKIEIDFCLLFIHVYLLYKLYCFVLETTSNDGANQSAGDEKVKEKFSLNSEKVQLTNGKQIYHLKGKVNFWSSEYDTFHFCVWGLTSARCSCAIIISPDLVFLGKEEWHISIATTVGKNGEYSLACIATTFAKEVKKICRCLRVSDGFADSTDTW